MHSLELNKHRHRKLNLTKKTEREKKAIRIEIGKITKNRDASLSGFSENEKEELVKHHNWRERDKK